MKKITTFMTLILCLTFFAQAQYDFNSPFNEEPVEGHKINKRTGYSVNSKVERTTGWFNYFSDLENIWGFSALHYRSTLFPDSSVLVQNGTSFDWCFKLGYGQTFDPTSDFHSTPIKDVAKYTVDSISIPYMYFRPQKGNPDTLIISVFRENQLNINPSPGWSIPRSYANAPYDTVADKGLNPQKEIVYLLEDKDIQDDVTGYITWEIDMDIPAGEIIAVTFSYLPGNTVNFGDTMGNTLEPFGPQTRNAFSIWDGRDENSTLDNDYYNMGQWITKAVGYNLLSQSNGWEGSYIPGVAYGNMGGGVRHMDINFLVTYDDFSGISEEAAKYNFKAYPNPFKDELKIDYDLLPSQSGQVEIVNVLGEVVDQVRLESTSQRVSYNMGDHANGLYFARLIVDNKTITTVKVIKE